MNIQPTISIVVVIFNMAREIKRTLYSLTSTYQVGVRDQDYEVIVVDNGSSAPLSVDYVQSFGPNFNYYYLKDASPSPASAINFGVRQSRGSVVGIMIDGARILSPGIIKYALYAFKTFQNPVVSTLGWHLGPDIQTRSILTGYNQQIEDQLLESIDWPKDGYRLFEISSLAGSSKDGWFMPIGESNCLFMLKETFDKLSGYDERFDMPGGGLVNLDMYARACELPDVELVAILGEGNFHQIHGGVATNVSKQKFQMLWEEWKEQYFRIRHKRYMAPTKRPRHIGHVPRQALKWLLYSAAKTAIGRLKMYRRRLVTVLRRLHHNVNPEWHRKWGLWEEIGKLQFDFLVEKGLKPNHYFLDVGCGSLRGGVHFIRYLELGRYFGIDKDKAILDAGRNVELKRNNLIGQKPILVQMDNFDFQSLNTQFNYALAQSVFTHLSLNSIIRCIMNIEKVLAPDGQFYATFFENPQGKNNLEPIMHPRTDGAPITTYLDKDPFHYDFETFEYICEGTSLKVEYIGDWNHPRDQKMLVFTKREVV